jgi:hypothetical protein
LLCEGLASGFWRFAGTTDEGEGCVSDLGEDLGRGAGSDAAGVFFEGHVAGVEQAVFDLPMVARELE